jgi:hypothetical protein
LEIEQASKWFVEEGMSVAGESKNYSAVVNQINKIGPRLKSRIRFEKSDQIPGAIGADLPYHAKLFMSHQGTIASVECVERLIGKDGNIYEYWVIKIGDKMRSEYTFIITKAAKLFAKRAMEFSSTRFVEKFEYKDGTIIYFPMNARTISHLYTRSNPEAFKGTALEGKWAAFENGELVIKEAR